MSTSPASPNLSQLSKSIEDALRTTLQDRTQPLYRLMEYHMGWVDEHGIAQAPRATPAPSRFLVPAHMHPPGRRC